MTSIIYDYNIEIQMKLMSHFFMQMFLASLSMVLTFRRIFVLQEYVDISDFNNRNQLLTAKLLKQGYQHHYYRKAFSNF